jgi:hypothetical protein
MKVNVQFQTPTAFPSRKRFLHILNGRLGGPQVQSESCCDFKYEWGLISLWLYKENNKLRDWKHVFTLHIPPWTPHTYDFVVVISLTHPRKILLVALQVGKAKDLSAPILIPSPVGNVSSASVPRPVTASTELPRLFSKAEFLSWKYVSYYP